MRILPPVEEKIRRVIRDARAQDPLISVSDLHSILEKKLGRSFSRKYIAKLSDKVARQSLVEADRTKIEQRLDFTRENYRIVRERLMRIVCWTPDPDNPTARPPANKDIIEAGKNIVMMDLALLSAELANGLYKRPVADIARETRYDPLPQEVRAVIIASWKRGGLLPPATIEAMVPAAEPETTNV
jgi:hypothetical protein